MKRVAVARIFQETSSFSPRATTIRDFQQFGLHFGDDVLRNVGDLKDEIRGFEAVARSTKEFELVPIMWAVGWTGGPLTNETFAFLRDRLLSGIESALPVDGVLIALHGSMVAESTYDCEGVILSEMRDLLAPHVPIVATFDHHANITERIIKNVNALTAYNECPHSDVFETGVRGADLMRTLLKGEIKPVVSFQKIPMVTPADKFETGKEPLKDWFELGRASERQAGVLTVSQFPVQPWLDVPEYGWSVVVVTDRKERKGRDTVQDLSKRAWSMRRDFLIDNPPPKEAIEMALGEEGPVVIADGADATNGGAPGDSTILLAELLEQRVTKKVFLTMVDHQAVETALNAGIGNEVTVELGGKQDPVNSRPVRVTGRVIRASDGRFRIEGGSHHSIAVNMGRTVVLQVGSLHIVVSEQLNPGHDPLVYQHVGLDPHKAQIIIVKCVVGHMKSYDSIMRKTIWTDCPGVTPSNLSRLNHTQIQRPLFPFDKEMEWEPAAPG